MNEMTLEMNALKVNSLTEFKFGTDMSGMVIGPDNLVIIEEVEKRNISGIDRRFFKVACNKCSEKTHFVAQASNLMLGLTRSCKCQMGKPLPAEQRPHSDKNYLRLIHLGLIHQQEQVSIDCDDFANEVISDIGPRENSDQRLVRLNESDGWHVGNLGWSE